MFGLLAKSILKKVCPVSIARGMELIFDKTILPFVKDCERGKICQKKN